jgi:hypothetical protein
MSVTDDMQEPSLAAVLLCPCDVEDADVGDGMRLERRLRERHREMLWLSLAVVVGVLVLQVTPSGKVAPVWFPQLTLPETCGSRLWFGVACPGCGLTRSFIALAQGDVARSFTYNRVGWLLALAVLLQFPYRLLALRELRTRVVERSWPKWFGWSLIAALIGNWVGNVTALF